MIILEKQLPTPVRLLIHQEIRGKEIEAVESVPGRVIYLTILQCHICRLNSGSYGWKDTEGKDLTNSPHPHGYLQMCFSLYPEIQRRAFYNKPSEATESSVNPH